MPIPPEHQGRSVYHFTHADNLMGLLETGFLAKRHPQFPSKSYRSIAAESIQLRRSTMEVPCGPGGCVHDYVPLYFGSRSPMLLSLIGSKNVDQFAMLYFEFPIDLVERPDAVFTDASANRDAPPSFFHDSANLAKLDWKAIDSLKWASESEAMKQRRMAELLIHQALPVSAAARCVVWNEGMRELVKKAVGNRPFPAITCEEAPRYHWFTNLPGGKKRQSLVTGPIGIANRYREACEDIERERGKHKGEAQFPTLDSLLEALRNDFGCIPQTAELVGLESENGVHKLPVDGHSKQVVERLRALPEFGLFEVQQKLLVEAAAYLHDIGKGPRSRWDGNGGLQKVDPDHPVGAMPMMVEILTRQVGDLSQAAAATLTKLVCYHDLVGEVLGKGRAEQQIVDVADDAEELDLLFALGRADATALSDFWWDEDDAKALYERCLDAVNKKTVTD